MDNLYFSAVNLYLVKPSVLTYTTDNYLKFEQRPEDMDIAFRQDNRYFSITNNQEYLSLDKNINYHHEYIDVIDDDKILLIRYLYENNETLEDEEIEHIQSILKYFDFDELNRFLNNLKEEEHTIKIKKVRK